MKHTGFLRFTILLLILIQICAGSAVHAFTISGTVTTTGGNPVANARVLIDQGNKTVLSDANGKFSITDVTAGNVRLIAWTIGFKPLRTGSITISADLIKDFQFDTTNAFNINPFYIAGLAKTAPTIDASITDSEWISAAKITQFYKDTSGDFLMPITDAKLQTTARILYDTSNIYIALECKDADGTKLVGTDPVTGQDDHVETFIEPPANFLGGFDRDKPNYMLVTNCAGSYAGFSEKPGVSSWTDDPWNTTGVVVKSVRSSVSTNPVFYNLEMKIPLASIPEFAGVTPEVGDVIRMAFERLYTTTAFYANSSITTKGYPWDSDQFNDIILGNGLQTFTTSSGFVQPGKWNLISLPAVPSNTDPKAVFAGIDVANASFQYWNNQAETPGFVGYGLGWTGPTECGVSYWMVEPSATIAKNISYEGIANMKDQVISVPAHASAPYWISIGLPFNSANYPVSNVKFSSNGGAYMNWTDAYNANPRIVDSSMQGYNAATGTFDRVNGLGTDTIQPWWGYWMLIFDGNKLDIKFPAPTK